MEDKIEKIKEYLQTQNKDIQAIILFGSYARRTQTEESDIDIAIKCEKAIDNTNLQKQQIDLEELTKKDIDLIDLDKITDSFRYEILINGEVLYCKNEYQLEQYKLEQFREYLELNESRQDIINAIKRGEGIYGK